MDDPALFAACALYDALTRRGVAIAGHPVARHRSASDDYGEQTGREVASRTSPSLIQLLQVIAKVSQNLHAELMLREVGRVTRQQGTREAGLEELSALLSELGASNNDARMEDGSGLSRNALVTPRLVTRLLTKMHRLCCISEGRGIRAKTGSLSRALALSGYADSKTRGRLAFSILVNDFSAPPSEVRRWIDKMAAALLE